ncbi:heat shock protein HSP20 family protein [Ceratobasidium sp. AG-Ba]|nr:heat shock protein HSP20 family protein [Ceratobasidium sp. AG-Ba]QRV91765.1 heat shock protein HSP20 family protein [Ceratobasidium sp. AG-Ba]
MSFSRSLLSDFDPVFFQLVQDPRSVGGLSQRSNQQQQPHQRQAHAEVTEEEKEYRVLFEVPGVQKKDLEVHVGNDGKSVTIEGHVHRTNKPSSSAAQPSQAEGTSGKDQAQKPEQNGTYEYRSTFSRTIGFHHAVDASKVQANLADGVLTLNLPKRVDPGRQRISIQ